MSGDAIALWVFGIMLSYWLLDRVVDAIEMLAKAKRDEAEARLIEAQNRRDELNPDSE